jgi:thiamine-phosphate pyrophosphorylase
LSTPFTGQLIGSLFKIYLITDRKLASTRGGLIAMTEAALSAAAPNTVAVQLREKDLEASELVELARQLRTVCDRHHARLLVNDRLDVAIAAGADGVHLPANSFAVADARGLLGSRRIVGVSTHHDSEVIAASLAGADFVVYGPVFDPVSKAGYTNARGADGLMAACRSASIPVFALGGITAARISELCGRIVTANDLTATATHRHPVTETTEKQAAGTGGVAASPAGVAVIGTIYGASDPAAAMTQLFDALAFR